MWTWFGLAVLALIGELLTGTFYLLVVAVGLAAAGIAAWLALSPEAQLIAFGVVVLTTLVVLRKTRVLKKREISPERNANVIMDIGQTVEVTDWERDGTTRVQYRGAAWQASLAEEQANLGETPQPGAYVITEMRGNRLILARKRN